MLLLLHARKVMIPLEKGKSCSYISVKVYLQPYTNNVMIHLEKGNSCIYVSVKVYLQPNCRPKTDRFRDFKQAQQNTSSH